MFRSYGYLLTQVFYGTGRFMYTQEAVLGMTIIGFNPK